MLVFAEFLSKLLKSQKMVDAEKWSKMKPMVENNLTTFFWSNMGTDF